MSAVTTETFLAASPKPLRCALLFCALILSLSTPGCGEEASVADTSTAIDACRLLQKADVEAVLGRTVGEAEATTRGDGAEWMSTCNYHSDTDDDVVGAGLLVRPHHADGGAKEAYAAHEKELIDELGAGAALTPVDGIGERAGWQTPNRVIGQLTVFEGPYLLILSISTAPGGDQLSPAKTLAQKVLQRLSQHGAASESI
jgi:hypothetical protein